MTQAAIGGPASTTYRVTSRQGVIGRDAQRVYVVSDGRTAEGGPQQAVYYVSDAEIAAGDFVISGNKPIPIVEVGPVGVEYPPIAVYVVTASSASDFPPQADPTPPPDGDPIGDALRALYTFYLPFDEADTGTRHDAVGDNDLSPTGDINALAYTAGKVGNAARWGAPNYSLLYKKISDSGLDFTTQDCYWSCWVRSLNGDNTQQIISVAGGVVILDVTWVPFGETYIYSVGFSINEKFATGTVEIAANEWHMIEAYYDKSADEIGVALDGGAFAVTGSVGAIVIVDPNAIFNIGKNDDDCDIDEFGFGNTIPSPELRAELYQRLSAGQTLFP